MRIRRLSFLVTLVALIGLGIGWQYVQGQGQTRPPAPTAVAAIATESLLPEDSVLLARVDGSLLHAEAFKKTAAYDAFYKSGLVGAVEKTFNRAKGMAGPLPVKPYLDALQLICDKGVSIAVSPGMSDQGPQPFGVVVLHEGATLDKVLSSIVQLAGNEQLKAEKKTIGKRTVTRMDIPDSPGVEVGWWAEGKHLVVAVGINGIAQAIQVADGETPNVTTNPLWAKYSQSKESELTSFGWLNLVPLRAIFGGMPVPTQNQDKPTTVQELRLVLGLDNLNSIGVQAGIKDRSLTSLTSIDAPGERRGLLSLLDQEPMTIKDLPPLPQQLSSFMAYSFDSAKAVQTLYDTAVELEKVMSPDTANVSSARAMAKEQLGLDVIDDLLSGLGNVNCVYNDEAQTGFGIAPALLVNVKDAGKLNTALEHLLVELLPQMSKGNAKGVMSEKNGTKTYVVEIPLGGLSPAISVSDKWLCVSILPQPVMAFNLRVQRELPTWEVATLPKETSAAIPASFTGLTIVDPRSTYRMIVGLAPMAAGFGQTALTQSKYLLNRPEQEGPFVPPPMIFKMSDLPPAELVTKWLYPNVAYSVVDENGLTTRTTSSVPGLPVPGGGGGASSVAVPAVLVALLLPAVQQAREAARRSQSKNNLKQIVLALHNYHETFNGFPAGTVENKDLGVEERLSWMVSILPFMEQAPLYNQIDMKEGHASATNAPLLLNAIPTYLNPGLPAAAEATHYVGIGGITEEGPTAKLPSQIAGVFGYDRKTRIADITDGTSNTIIVAESTGSTGPWGQGGTSTIRAFTKQPYINGPDGIGGPFHGGCNMAMADGSVRFVSENIDPKVVEALSTIQGGEVVNDF